MNDHEVVERPSHSPNDDEKLVSSISTILVASIQDAKDRISQIEYIFCTQLYPNLHSKSNSLLKLKETELHELRLENHRISEEVVAKRRRIEELQREVDEGKELVQSRGLLLAGREKELKESEEKRSAAIARVSELEEEIENCGMKTELLLKKIDYLDEKLGMKTREVEELREKLMMKTREVEKGEELREKLRLKVLESEKENEVLVEKVKCLEERIIGEDSYRKLLEQVESVTSELQSEKMKRNRLTEAYKRLKSQHNYLRDKVGLSEENMIHQNKSENERDFPKHKSPITEHGVTFENPYTSMDACKTAKVKTEIPEDNFGGLDNRTPDMFVGACETNKVKEKTSEDDKGANLRPPSSSFNGAPNSPSNTKSVSGTKRPASSWRQTRTHQSRAGPDPHDDFLDTPLENIRENINKDLNKDNLPDPIQEDIIMNSSDDETQDLNAKSSPQKKQSSIPTASKRSYKYVEPVRKKAERENLKGVECKQCRKFYEAVLPNGDGKEPDSSKQNFRCEHLDGVSRHRYRYVPPMTPEGFWNIGFESEM